VRRALLNDYSIGIGTAYAVGTSEDAWYETDALAYVRDIRIQCESDDGCTWSIDVEYGEINPDDVAENPLARPPIRWVEPVQLQVPADVTFDDPPKAVLNSAYDPFDPPILRDFTRLDWVVERNELASSFNVAWIEFYQ